MTQEEFDNLNRGDVVQNTRTGALKTIVQGFAGEPGTQTTKDNIRERMAAYSVMFKAVPKPEPALVENAVQAIGRDVVAEAIMREPEKELEIAGRIVLGKDAKIQMRVGKKWKTLRKVNDTKKRKPAPKPKKRKR